MFVNPARLESINELPKKETKPMLTTDHIEKLELSYNWILDVATSQEYLSLENNRQLDVALTNIDKVLKDNQPCAYPNDEKLIKKKLDDALNEIEQYRKHSISYWLWCLAKNLSVFGVQISFIGIVLCGLGTVFCYGVDRVQQSRGEDYQPTWSNEAKVFEGLAISSFAVGVGAVVVGVCASGGEQDG
ncbi:hypothetical protein B4U84_29280 [Westiellopsis prolifica IICB1]|nr:hypothetical protein B4U84_29280 [Westiellopsis prolifica IICB1]